MASEEARCVPGSPVVNMYSPLDLMAAAGGQLFRTTEEVTAVMKRCGIKTIRMQMVLRNGNCNESLMTPEELSDDIYQGFTLGSEFVYPHIAHAMYNPFVRHGTITIPCYPFPAQFAPPMKPLPQALSAQAPPIHEMSAVERQKEEARRAAKQLEELNRSRKMSKKGTSCHQCKNTKHMAQLAFCAKTYAKRSRNESRKCRKKFCRICLGKFYGEQMEEVKQIPGWCCPSCRGDCVCASCVRNRTRGSDSGASVQQSAIQTKKVKLSPELGGSAFSSPAVSSDVPAAQML